MVTALEKFTKLEAEGTYSGPDGAAPRDVVLGFGGRSLVIVTPSDVVVAHWPLATLERLSAPGAIPMTVAPDRSGDERVTLTDREMIDAIAQVCPNLTARPRRRIGRTRPVLAGLALAAILVWSAIASAPDAWKAMVGFLAEQRGAYLGERLMSAVPALWGIETADKDPVCAEPAGVAALAALGRRIGVAGTLTDVAVLAGGAPAALALPGGRAVLSDRIIAEAGSPEAVAGVLAHLAAQSALRMPSTAFAHLADTLVLARVLTGIGIPDEAVFRVLTRMAGDAADPRPPGSAEAATARVLADTGLPTLPFAGLLRQTGLALGDPALLERADAMGSATFRPALDDQAWLSLRNICDRRRDL